MASLPLPICSKSFDMQKDHGMDCRVEPGNDEQLGALGPQ
jgi:hypothetical protein